MIANDSTRRRTLRILGWLMVFDIVLMLSVSGGYLAYAQPPENGVAMIFTAAMFVTQMTSLAFLAFVPLLLLTLIWPLPRSMQILAAGIGTIVVAALGLDVLVYQQYRTHIDAAILDLIFGGAASEIFVFSTAIYLQAAICFVILIALQCLIAWLASRLAKRPSRLLHGSVVGVSLFIVVLGTNLTHAWADAAGYSPMLRPGALMPAYYPLRSREAFASLGISVPHIDSTAASKGIFHYPLAPVECLPPTKPYNIVYLLIDTWRADALTAKATPNIHRFAQNNLQFKQHYSGGSCTRTGIFSMMYGLPGTYWHVALSSEKSPVLMNKLLAQNYQMGIFASAQLTSPEFGRTVFANVPNLRTNSKANTTIGRDREITAGMQQFLRHVDGNKPFLLWGFYDAVHAFAVPKGGPMPFKPSWKTVHYTGLDPDTDPTEFHHLYLNATHFVDSQVGKILDQLRQQKLLDSTIVIISSDHGTEFNETGRNFWGHNSAFNQYQTHVPLVIHWPGHKAQTFDYRTSHFDISPTLLHDALNCSTAMGQYSVGHDLFTPGGRDFLLLANYGNYAIKTPTRTIEVYPLQNVDVLGTDGKIIPGAKPDPSLIVRAMRLKRKFLR